MVAEETLIRYSWWGGDNDPPEHLKTKKQLSEIGLRPIAPVGVICTKKFDCLLYDINSSDSVKPKRQASEAQKTAAIKNGIRQRWVNNKGLFFEQARVNAVKWARHILQRDDVLIFDTETTGLDWEDEIIELAICKIDRTVPRHENAGDLWVPNCAKKMVGGACSILLLALIFWRLRKIESATIRFFSISRIHEISRARQWLLLAS